MESSLEISIRYIIDSNMQYVSELAQSPVLTDYETLINAYSDQISVLEERLKDSVLYINENKSLLLSALAGRLNALSPLAVLARGYILAEKGSDIIRSVSQIKKKDKIELILQDGKAGCTIDEVIQNG